LLAQKLIILLEIDLDTIDIKSIVVDIVFNYWIVYLKDADDSFWRHNLKYTHIAKRIHQLDYIGICYVALIDH